MAEELVFIRRKIFLSTHFCSETSVSNWNTALHRLALLGRFTNRCAISHLHTVQFCSLPPIWGIGANQTDKKHAIRASACSCCRDARRPSALLPREHGSHRTFRSVPVREIRLGSGTSGLAPIQTGRRTVEKSKSARVPACRVALRVKRGLPKLWN